MREQQKAELKPCAEGQRGWGEELERAGRGGAGHSGAGLPKVGASLLPLAFQSGQRLWFWAAYTPHLKCGLKSGLMPPPSQGCTGRWKGHLGAPHSPWIRKRLKPQ